MSRVVMEEESLAFIPTRGSMLKNGSKQFQVVKFESYKSKKEKTDIKDTDTSADNNIQNEFNIKRAKQEIIKFGMDGFDPQKKEEAKIKLLIKLGAKPPKNKYKNYKLLQTEKKKEKKRESSRLLFQQLGKNNIGKSNAKGKSFDRKRRKQKDGLLDIYGKVKTTVPTK